MISISVVVPVYSGADYLGKLADAVKEVRQSLIEDSAPFEIAELIFVNDSAVDNSPEILAKLTEKHPWITTIHLSRNFGQHPATIAGILHTAGDWVVTMDEDLQHPPGRIPDLLKVAIQKNADIVYGSPEGKVHRKKSRDLTSKSFKRLIERLTGNSSITKVNSFRLIRGDIARAASSVGGYEVYFDVALSWFTQRVEVLSMELVDERFVAHGASGYNFKSLLSHARRLAFSSQIKLLRASAYLGFAMLSLSVAVAAALLILHLTAGDVIGAPGWTSLMLTISFYSGVIMLLLGITLEYISILVLKAHGKPVFFTIDRSSDRQLTEYFSESN